MKERDVDPRRLDVRAFAKAGAELSGEWPLAGFDRLRELLVPDADGVAPRAVRWMVTGEEVPVRGGPSQVWLHLLADAGLPMRCQRCLQPLVEPLRVERGFQFVADEAAAESLDNDAEHEVLVLSRELDLHELLVADNGEPEAAPTPGPFSALAALRRGQG